MTHPVRDGEPTGNIRHEAMRGQFFGSVDKPRRRWSVEAKMALIEETL
jgi:hypothetical protein